MPTWDGDVADLTEHAPPLRALFYVKRYDRTYGDRWKKSVPLRRPACQTSLPMTALFKEE